ncbi:hypothetical protein ACFY94_06905 [Streptomyces griseorubiginosus]|uniref:hypothetical protein n=1 Tax=Streptomyces griseorubiginosus TaxID=67304 RepID=UPI0036E6195A
MTLLTISALLLHLLAPPAPPRMLARAGMIDTAHVWGPAVYGDPHTDAAANQYAAMPSLRSVCQSVGVGRYAHRSA